MTLSYVLKVNIVTRMSIYCSTFLHIYHPEWNLFCFRKASEHEPNIKQEMTSKLNVVKYSFRLPVTDLPVGHFQ